MAYQAEDSAEENEFKPLTAEEARQWRVKNPPLSLWWVWRWQLVVGGLVALAAGLVSGQVSMAMSAGYGALAVVLPGAVYARGLSSRMMRLFPGAAMLGFFVWELVKIILTVAILFAAPRMVQGLSWLVLLLGFVLTMKVYWVMLVLHSRRQHSVK
jgi:ATP synthase protein I